MRPTLIHFNKARQELALAHDIGEVKDIRDKAEALRAYAKQAGEGLDMQNQCAEIKIRAERRAGELLKETVQRGGDRKSKSHDPTLIRGLPEGISHDQSSRWQKVASVPEKRFDEHVEQVKAQGEELTTAGVLRLAQGKPALYTSAASDWNTPADFLKLVVATLGAIDLDPCSNSATKPNVPAKRHFTEAEDGLTHRWAGRVYMNPPYGSVLPVWVEKLCSECEAGNVSAAIALVPARTDTQWFRRMRPYLRCFIWGRLKFSGQQNCAPFPSMAVYLGGNLTKFVRVFSRIGDIYGPIEDAP